MEVAADLAPVLGSPLVRIDGLRFKQLHSTPEFHDGIDKLGRLSATSMGLIAPLTSSEVLLAKPDQVLYVLWERAGEEGEAKSRLLGYLKIGYKSLFVFDKEMHGSSGRVLCLLDFYVHHAQQRKGHGKALFEAMLKTEGKAAAGLALDSPSQTLLAFMASQYGLVDPIWQNTNYVVYQSFFGQEGVARADVAVAQGPEGMHRAAPHKPPNEPCGKDGMQSSRVGDLSTEGTLASRSSAAHARKTHILSNTKLW